MIATYALCGFSNVGSVGIMMGAMGAMAPDRKAACASMAVRALVCGSVACFLTACVAGTSHLLRSLSRHKNNCNNVREK